MKTLYISLFAIFLIACKMQPDAVRKLTHNNQVNPSGTVWLRDSIYMDECEVRNLDYLEYLHWTKKYDSVNYAAALPDTTVWHNEPFRNEELKIIYLRHPGFRNCPVVGVSYDQAVAFCKWRTERVKGFIKKTGKENSKKYAIYKKIEYRLPTEEEWKCAASAGLEDPSGWPGTVTITEITTGYTDAYCPNEFGFISILDRHNLPKMWVKESMILHGVGKQLLIPVNSGSPNRYGFYNMIGNVAEMVAEKGISKGGSVLNALEECEIANRITYDKSSRTLGFRCVCVIHQ